VERNFTAIDAAIEHLHEVNVPGEAGGTIEPKPPVSERAPDFVRRITAELIAGRGDELPVSAIPADGTWPLGTAAWEKRNLAPEIPVWDEDLCIQCGKCAFVCPHAAIRAKVFPHEESAGAPPTFKHVPVRGKEFDCRHAHHLPSGPRGLHRLQPVRRCLPRA